jgi:hypothetical protein
MADENLGWQPDEEPAIGNSRLAKAVRAFDEAVQSGQTDLSRPVAPSDVTIDEPEPSRSDGAPTVDEQTRLDKLESTLQQLATVVSNLAHHDPSRTPGKRLADDRLLQRLADLEGAMKKLQAKPAVSNPPTKAQPDKAEKGLRDRLEGLEHALASVRETLDAQPPPTAPEAETKMLTRLGGLEVAVAQLQTGEATPMHGLTALVEQMGVLEAAISAMINRVVAIEAELAVARARSGGRPPALPAPKPDMHRVQEALRRLTE